MILRVDLLLLEATGVHYLIVAGILLVPLLAEAILAIFLSHEM
jgi:hypothetical protein